MPHCLRDARAIYARAVAMRGATLYAAAAAAVYDYFIIVYFLCRYADGITDCCCLMLPPPLCRQRVYAAIYIISPHAAMPFQLHELLTDADAADATC